jgi:hypothetical protein
MASKPVDKCPHPPLFDFLSAPPFASQADTADIEDSCGFQGGHVGGRRLSVRLSPLGEADKRTRTGHQRIASAVHSLSREIA